MNFILWIIIGGILGWIASIIMRTNAQQGLFLNIVVGIIGCVPPFTHEVAQSFEGLALENRQRRGRGT